MKGKGPGAAFISLGVAFCVIGFSQRNLFPVGIVFLVLGIIFTAREQRARGQK
jgi:hypothetical protein